MPPDRRPRAPSGRTVPPVPGSLRRRVYLWAIALGLGVVLLIWGTQLGSPAPDRAQLAATAAQFALCVWAAWWLLSGRPLVTAERAVFVVNALVILAQLLQAMGSDPAQQVGLASSTYWTLMALAVLAFLLFDNRQALFITASLYALAVGVPWAALLARGTGLTHFAELARVQLSCGAVLVLLSLLAWYRERFALERGERLSLEQLANTDPLTGLPNRRALYARIEELLTAARQGRPGCLMLLDVDHFKRVNDTHGHGAGDELLVQLAGLLRAGLPTGGAVGRWGGEEFLMVLPGLPARQAFLVAEQLRQQLARQLQVSGQPVTASLGLTACLATDDLPRCVARADAALYAAKAAGRNRTAGDGAQETAEAALTP